MNKELLTDDQLEALSSAYIQRLNNLTNQIENEIAEWHELDEDERKELHRSMDVIENAIHRVDGLFESEGDIE